MPEGLIIDPTGEDATNVALSLHNGSTTFLMEVDYPTPDLDSMYQSSVDTEGDPLVQQRYKNRVITGKLRVVGATAAALQTTLGYLQQKAGKLNREAGTLVRTAPSGDTVAFDVVGCKIDMPVTGRLVTINRAEVSFWFECRPFGRGAAVTLAGHTEATLPVLIFTETGVQGDVPALGRLVLTEGSGASQATVVWGLRSRTYSSASSAALFFQAEGLTTQGGATTSTAAAGYSGTGSVFAGTLATGYQSILSSQATGGGTHWSHVGEYRLMARVQVPAANTGAVTVRAQWAVGDGRVWTSNAETTIGTGIEGVWRMLDLGTVNVAEVVAGTQRWEARLLAKSTVAGDDIHVDWLMLVPIAEGSGVASAIPAAIDYSIFQARDEFDQSAGALAGKTPNTGGNWAGAGDADDFSVSGSGTATRTAVSDTSTSLGNARLATMATPSSLAGLSAQVSMSSPFVDTGGTLKQGMLLRYVDSSNFLAVYATPQIALPQPLVRVQIVERIAGTDWLIGQSGYFAADHTNAYDLKATVGADGSYAVAIRAPGGAYAAAGDGQSANLATGGTLASGKVGILDHYTAAGALTRTYYSFMVYGASADAAVFASQSMEIRNDGVLREDSGGTLWQPVSKYEGDYHLVPPAGREQRTVEYIAKLSRGAIETGIDSGIDDLSGTLSFVPRFLVVPE